MCVPVWVSSRGELELVGKCQNVLQGCQVHSIDVTFGLHCFAPGFAFRRVLGLGLALFGVECGRVCGWLFKAHGVVAGS